MVGRRGRTRTPVACGSHPPSRPVARAAIAQCLSLAIRPQTGIRPDFAQGPITDHNAVFRASFCGAERSHPKLRRLRDLKVEAVEGGEFRRFVTRSGRHLGQNLEVVPTKNGLNGTGLVTVRT